MDILQSGLLRAKRRFFGKCHQNGQRQMQNSRREQVQNWIENNILSNNNVRQLLWDVAQTEGGDEVDDLSLVLLSPGLRTIEILADGGMSGAGTPGKLSDRMILPQDGEWRIRRRSINILEVKELFVKGCE